MREENAREIVDTIFTEKFDMEDVELEIVHRDGKIRHGPRNRGPNRPRHILIKLLRYQDKVEIMKNRKECLKDDSYYIADDLTRKDLEEKHLMFQQSKGVPSKHCCNGPVTAAIMGQ